MGVITSVESISKTKYRICIDGRFAFVLNKGELLHYRLQKDMEIAEELEQEILDTVVLKEAKIYVNRILTTADKTVQQLRDGMRRKEFPKVVIDKVLDLCIRENLLNDARYAVQYVSSNAGTKSLRVIRMELQQKGIREDLIEDALRQIDSGEQETEAVLRILRKKWPYKEERSYEEMQKLMAYVMRKGFSYETVRRTIRLYESTCDPESEIDFS